MAEIAPFKGIFYNPQQISVLADVVTPPYDVISAQEQNLFYERHPNNTIRLILGKPEKNDTYHDNPHTRAAGYFSEWMKTGVLKRDEIPSLYLSSMQFEWDGTQYTRFGLIALVRIEPFEKGIILPHEKTFSRVKTERLNLMKACNTNFDPVFSLFPDEKNLLLKLTQEIQSQSPDIDFIDHFNQRHRLWRLSDPDIHRYAATALASESLFIADGHHRYETALNYRNWMMEKEGGISSDHPANFVMMYLSSMKDPGLVVLPAHRLLKEVDDKMMAAVLEKGRDFFDIVSMPFDPVSREKVEGRFISELRAMKDQNTIGLLHKGNSAFYLLTLKTDAMEKLFSDTIHPTLKELDVTILTHLIFIELLGFDQQRLDNEQLIGYKSRDRDAIDSVIAGEYDAVFLLNATKIEQVRSVAQNRLTMPRKTTYFYPKVVAGIVQNVLTP